MWAVQEISHLSRKTLASRALTRKLERRVEVIVNKLAAENIESVIEF